jgi:hypothetical protein
MESVVGDIRLYFGNTGRYFSEFTLMIAFGLFQVWVSLLESCLEQFHDVVETHELTLRPGMRQHPARLFPKLPPPLLQYS